MSPLFQLFSFVLLVILTLTGLVGNGFIAIIKGIDWFRSRQLSPADMILSCLSLFRFAFLVVVMQTAIFLLFFGDTIQKKDLSIASNSSWHFLNTADLWFGTWLSVLYCVKIANFSHPLFLQMKRRFPGLVPWLLLGTVVYSAIIATIGAIIDSRIMSECDSDVSLLSNNTDSGIETSDFCQYSIFLYVVPDLVPFTIFLFSSILLLTSLWRHKKLLQNSARDVSTEVHLNAIKALASFSILYISSFFVEILSEVSSWMYIADLWVQIFFYNVIAVYSSGHAVILIFINPKLKQEAVRILHQLKKVHEDTVLKAISSLWKWHPLLQEQYCLSVGLQVPTCFAVTVYEKFSCTRMLSCCKEGCSGENSVGMPSNSVVVHYTNHPRFMHDYEEGICLPDV